MTFLDIVAFAAIVVVAFALRIYPATRMRWFGNDAYYHLQIAREINQTKAMPKVDHGMIPSYEHTYPPLLQVLVAPFVKNWERGVQRYFMPIVDLVCIVVLCLFSRWIGIWEPLLPALVYAMCPPNIIDATSLNPRPLSNLLVALAFAISIIFWDSGNLLLLILVLVLESSILLTHKLGAQTVIAVHLVLAGIMMWNDVAKGLLFLLVLPGSFLLAAGVTGGYYFRVTLRDHIKYLRVHFAHGHYRTGLKAIPSPIESIKSNPVSFVAPFLGLFLIYDGNRETSLVFLTAWSLTVLVLAQSWIWGDGWRYLQFGSFSGAVLIVWFFAAEGYDNTNGVIAIVALSLVLGVIGVLLLRRLMKNDIAQRLGKALDRLPEDWKSRLASGRIYSNVWHYFIPYETRSHVMFGNPSARGMELGYKLRELGKTSIDPVLDFAKNSGEKIDYVLLFKGFEAPSLSGLRTVYDSDDLSILEA